MECKQSGKEPAEMVGHFFRLRERGWHSLKRNSIVYVEKYLKRRREFIVWSYADSKRYGVILLEFNRNFYYCNPQPVLESSP